MVDRRHPPLSDEDLENIADKVADTLVTRKRAEWIDPQTHIEHHNWVNARIYDEAQWKAFRHKVLQSTTIWALLLVLAFVGKALLDAIISIVKTGHV